MIRYKCIVAYDGSNYFGWQIQPSSPSIQSTIQKVLSQLFKTDIHIFGSGRTDSQVNAIGQVFHFDAPFNIPTHSLMKGLNTLLPENIYIKNVSVVSADFHARFSAVGKWYRYRINLGEYDVHLRKVSYQYCKPLNINLMKEAAQVFIGTHDFTSFNATSLTLNPDQVRTIYSLEMNQEKDELLIDIKGNGFLKYMVRMIVGALIEVGKEKIDKKKLEYFLDIKDKQAHSYLAKPNGLTLMEVYYEEN